MSSFLFRTQCKIRISWVNFFATPTVRFHVDDLKSSHIDPKVNDNFLSWLNSKYGEHGEVKAIRGKVHNYLGMTFAYGDDGYCRYARLYEEYD